MKNVQLIKNNNKQQLSSIVSLRFFAMFAVFLCHCSFLNHVIPSLSSYLKDFGGWGVSFFIILSGFIITYNYLDKFKIWDNNLSKEFILKRIKKIYPLHIFTLILFFPMIFLYPNISNFIKLLFNITLTQSWVPDLSIAQSFNAVSWTLSTLMFFYIFTPILLIVANKINKFKYGHFIIIIILFILEFLITKLGYNESDKMIWFIYESPYVRILDYCIGISLGGIFLSKKNDINNSNKYVFTFVEVISIIILVILFIYKKTPILYRYTMYWTLINCVLIYVFSSSKGFISKLLINKRLLYLGNISFSFYLMHYTVITYTNFLFYSILKLNINTYIIIIQFIIVLGLSLLASAFVHRYIESIDLSKLKNIKEFRKNI